MPSAPSGKTFRPTGKVLSPTSPMGSVHRFDVVDVPGGRGG
jgi:hypothetical protein